MPKQNSNRVVTAAAALVAGGALAVAGVSLANANTGAQSPTNVPAAAVGYDAPQGGPSANGRPLDGTPGDGRPGDGQRPWKHEHTEVTGDELAKVTEAVTAKDSAVSVTSVRKDPDGSYDVFGTKDGSPVMVEVSADLKTVEVRTGGPGGMGRHRKLALTEVTGDEATKVTEAVRAKDGEVAVTSVRKAADGSYRVMGTKAGSPVMVQVSADLKTVEVRTGGPGGKHGGPRRGDRSGQPSQAETGTSTTPSSHGAVYVATV